MPQANIQNISQKASPRGGSEGAKLSTLEMNRLTVEEFHEAEKLPLIVVLDDVRSLYNVGSVFRSSDAFRIEAVYLCGITAIPAPIDAQGLPLPSELSAEPSSGAVLGSVAPLRDCTLKASQEIHKTALGAENSVAWRYFKDTKEAVASLKDNGYTVLAVEQCHGSIMLGDFKPSLTSSKDNTADITKDNTTDATLPLKKEPSLATEGKKEPSLAPYAVILGNEVKGVKQEVIDMCDACLEIPQYGTKHSLNVSVTAGIIIWHFSSILRQ